MTVTEAPAAAPAAQPPARPGRRRGSGSKFVHSLPWLLPALLLIAGVVLYPAGLMIYNSFRKFKPNGFETGAAGWLNYKNALTFPGVPIDRILVNTVVWVVVVVSATLVISLGLAQFLNKVFRGRKLVRLAIIVPWAASVVMTTSVFSYGLNPDYGLMNRFLVDIGILDQGYGFTKNPTSAFWVSVGVAIFVSLPFTTYTILAGLQAVPGDVLEAADMDGASPVQTYWRVVLPILRPAIAVAALINIINVFNSLPILKILNETPGYNTGHITTTLIFEYKLKLGPGVSSALSVINFCFCLIIIAIYLVLVRPTKEQ